MKVGRLAACVSRMLVMLAFVQAAGTAAAATATWSGNALLDSNWSSNNNWAGVGGANPGDALVFPGGAGRRTNTNDFPGTTSVPSITFSNAGNCNTGTNCNYVLNGGGIVLGSAGITADVPSGTLPVINLPVALSMTTEISTTAANSSPLTFGGDIALGLNQLSVTVAQGGFMTINGDLTGPGRIVKFGGGRLTINGNGAAMGSSVVNDGTLVVNGTIGDLNVSGSSVLRGTGTFGDLNGGSHPDAVIHPGSGAGTTGTGILTAGNVIMGERTLQININGTTAGSGYSRLVTASASLNFSHLSVTLGTTVAAGTTFTIVTGAISGQFLEGDGVIAGDTLFDITYNANSVVLTARKIKTWNGAGANSNWSNGANWVGGVAPIAGDPLVFPPGAARLSNTNDFLAGTAFRTISITGTGYTLSGNAIELAHGLNSATGAGTANVVALPLTLNGLQTLAASGTGLTLNGPISTPIEGATFDVASTLTIAGTISGAGLLSKQGTGTLILSGANTFTGRVNVNEGAVGARDPAAFGTTGVNSMTVFSAGTALVLQNATVGERVDIKGAGTGTTAGAIDVGACATPCALSGIVILAGNAAIGPGSGTLTLSGEVLQDATPRTLTKVGGGTLVLSGTNSYTGGTVISAGTLQVDSTVGAVTLNGGTLRGGGHIGTLTASGGTIAPGVNGPGILTASGAVTLAPGVTLAIDINGAGLLSDGFQVPSINLAGAHLAVTLGNGFNPPAGTSFTIVSAPGPVTGTFAEGASVTAGGRTFAINYFGTSVSLTAQPAQPDLIVTKSHTGNFSNGQVGMPYTITASNLGLGPKIAGDTVTVTDTAPAGMTVTAMSGTGWTCSTLPACTRSDALAEGASYPPITVRVNIAGNAGTPLANQVAVVTSGAEANTNNNVVLDNTTIVAGSGGSLAVVVAGSGTVTSLDGAINCGATCNAQYVNGSNVALAAAPAQGQVFTGWSGACTGTGPCLAPISGSTLVTAGFAAGPTATLDLDNSGAPTKYDALTDGLLLLRHLFGLTGTPLTAGALGGNAMRTVPADIAAFITGAGNAFDIDGNGTVDALTDGLLVLRYLFGLTGAPLTNGAIGTGATRTTPQQIADYLDTLMP